MRNLLLLFSLTALSACSLKWVSPDTYALRGLGEPRCAQTSSAEAAAACLAQKKRYQDEYDALQKEKSLSLKGATKDDSLCYKNPRAGEKACAITP